MSDAPAGLQNSAAVGVDYAAPGTEPATRKASTAPERKTVFDPSAHTVDEVQAYIAKHPAERDAVLAAEKAGKGRVTITETEPASK